MYRGKVMIPRGLFTSARQTWRTPEALYRALDEEFHFDHDPCPSPKLGELQEKDGLGSTWGAVNFVNPPYNDKQRWIKKGLEEWRKGKTVVFLLPSRTDTKFFHEEFIPHATEIRFLRGRLHFDERGPAPFPSMIVVFQGGRTTTSKP